MNDMPGVRLWHLVIAELADTDTPASLEEAVRDELAGLWTDLDHAISYAYNGRWSMGCDDLSHRIIRLSRLVGATPWENVPCTMLLSGAYQGLLTDAGIEHAEPCADDLRKMREWRSGQLTARPGLTPP